TAKLSETEKAFADAQAQVASLDEIKRKLADTQTSLEKAKSSSGDVAKLTKLRDDALRDKERMAEKLRLANEETSHAQSSTGQLKNELVAMKAELTNAQTKLAEQSKSIASLEGNVYTANQATEAAKSSLTSAQSAATDAAKHDAELSSIKEKFARNEEQLAVVLRSYTQLKAAHEELEGKAGQLDALNNEKEKITAELREANAQNEHSQAAVGQLQQELIVMKTQLTTTQAALATLNSEHSRLQDGRRTPTNPTPSTPAVPAPVRTHTIAAGETLTGISKKYYGTITRWQDVYNANHDVLKNPNSLPVGSELIIP
ncbi:MAG TPA: LysM peptidoglycan-binding domain-containing protein, partial [Opitutaceae bacterium]|nr:LysM peptidoglycan-binding domain-containing protein [Opitutaceae bacterium]